MTFTKNSVYLRLFYIVIFKIYFTFCLHIYNYTCTECFVELNIVMSNLMFVYTCKQDSGCGFHSNKIKYCCYEML